MKMNLKRCLQRLAGALLLSAALLGAAADLPITGTVAASRLNVRIRPGTQHAVVAQLEQGTLVTVLSRHDDWLEIAIPPTASVWVAMAFLADGKTTREVNLRSGPGVMHVEYGTIPAGTAVTVIDDSREGWRRIVPPAQLTAWVSADHVTITPPPPATPATATMMSEPLAETTDQPAATAPPPADQSPPVAETAETATPSPAAEPTPGEAPPPMSERLPLLVTAGEEVTMEGMVVPLAANAVFVTHAICAKVDDEYFPLCYVHADRQNLKLWEGQRVRISGRQRWVLGWQRPVIEVRKISPMR